MFSIINDRNKRAVLKALRRIEKKKNPIRIEVENTHIGFFSTLSVIREMVVIPRPPEIQSEVLIGGILRCKIPWNTEQYLRMTISATDYKQAWKSYSVIICDWPDKIHGGAQRAHDRFNTSRYKNIRLSLPEHPVPYRIVDLSPGGCKFLVPSAYPDASLEEGNAMEGAKMLLGSSVSIHLEKLVLQRIRILEKKSAIGCQMDVAEDGRSPQILSRLLSTIEYGERRRVIPT